jgi:hypothetical protein
LTWVFYITAIYCNIQFHRPPYGITGVMMPVAGKNSKSLSTPGIKIK